MRVYFKGVGRGESSSPNIFGRLLVKGEGGLTDLELLGGLGKKVEVNISGWG